MFRERRMSLADAIHAVEDLILCYELPIAVRFLRTAATAADAPQLAAILGLEPDSPDDVSYADGLLARARLSA